jgi:hypothetical protein
MLGLLRGQPQALKPARTVAASRATAPSGFVGHQPGNRQADFADDLAIPDDDLPAVVLGQPVGGQGHAGIVRADDDHLMAVVGNGRGDGTESPQAKAADQAHGNGAGGIVALDQGEFGDIRGTRVPGVRYGGQVKFATSDNRDFELEMTSGGVVLDDADDVACHLLLHGLQPAT